MKPSQQCVEIIKYFEGFRSTLYTCSGGKLTVGYGHVLTPEDQGKNFPMSEIIGEYMLKEDLRKRSNELKHCISTAISLEQYQFDALLSFLYNIGVTILQKSTLLKRVNEGRHIDAAEEFKRYIYAGRPKTIQPGLIIRRKVEADLYCGKLEGIDTDDMATYLDKQREIYEGVLTG